MPSWVGLLWCSVQAGDRRRLTFHLASVLAHRLARLAVGASASLILDAAARLQPEVDH